MPSKPSQPRDLPAVLPAVEWSVAGAQVAYPDAVAAMEARVAAIRNEAAPELIWLVEHPPLYTAGTSASDADLLDPDRFPVYATGRGGQHTYHGPGQRVAYAMMDLKLRGSDVRRYVFDLEEWMIRTVAHYGVTAERREGRVGIWVERGDGSGLEDKIGAIGVRVRKWVSFHGLALNVHPDLTHFSGIVPCGVPEHGVTSLAAQGVDASMSDVDAVLRDVFEDVFARETEIISD
ncbi:MAG: lipoyl(octanoyl) transferase LipB [Rhodospirillaceae bacterium]|nr:lipoyl(octanoyl) transferase LipB [Rhodospirillaceae bacterium]